MISINDKNELIYLGVQGETEARIVEFDFEDWIQQYGSGTLELVAQRNGEQTAYPIELAFYDNIAVWTVSDIDNARAGFGRCQLRYKVNDVIVKTAIFKTMTDVALGNTDEPGDPYQDIIDTLEELVDEAETAAESILDLSVDAETLASGSDASVEKQTDPETGEINLHFGIPTGPRGSKGDTGNGIADAVLNADYTLTLTFTDGTTYTTPSIRGQKGDSGTGIASIDLISTVGLVKTYRITYTDGTTYDYQVTDGSQGTPGNGIVSISKTGTSGLIDIYTITFSDGTTTTFNVTNGQDGHSPVITASKSGKVTTIYSDGTSIATVNDGQDGQDGSDYILTNQDKQDIADIVIADLPTWTGGNY